MSSKKKILKPNAAPSMARTINAAQSINASQTQIEYTNQNLKNLQALQLLQSIQAIQPVNQNSIPAQYYHPGTTPVYSTAPLPYQQSHIPQYYQHPQNYQPQTQPTQPPQVFPNAKNSFMQNPAVSVQTGVKASAHVQKSNSKNEISPMVKGGCNDYSDFFQVHENNWKNYGNWIFCEKIHVCMPSPQKALDFLNRCTLFLNLCTLYAQNPHMNAISKDDITLIGLTTDKVTEFCEWRQKNFQHIVVNFHSYLNESFFLSPVAVLFPMRNQDGAVEKKICIEIANLPFLNLKLGIMHNPILFCHCYYRISYNMTLRNILPIHQAMIDTSDWLKHLDTYETPKVNISNFIISMYFEKTNLSSEKDARIAWLAKNGNSQIYSTTIYLHPSPNMLSEDRMKQIEKNIQNIFWNGIEFKKIVVCMVCKEANDGEAQSLSFLLEILKNRFENLFLEIHLECEDEKKWSLSFLEKIHADFYYHLYLGPSISNHLDPYNALCKVYEQDAIISLTIKDISVAEIYKTCIAHHEFDMDIFFTGDGAYIIKNKKWLQSIKFE